MEFSLIPGEFKHVSLGSNSDVWGVSKKDEVYQWKGKSWDKKNGKLMQISVGSDGTVFGVNSHNKVHKRGGFLGWQSIHGDLKCISVGSSKHIWGLNVRGDIYKRVKEEWKLVPGKLKQISVNQLGDVYGISDKGLVYNYNGSMWRQIPGQLDFINVDDMGTVRGVFQNQVFEHHPKGWVNVSKKFPPGTRQFEAVNDHCMIAVDMNNQVHIKGVCKSGEKLAVIKTQNVIHHQPTTQQNRYQRVNDIGKYFTKVHGKLRQISAGSMYHVWGITTNGIFKRENNAWKQVPGALSHISVGNDGTVWGVQSNGDIFIWMQTGWQKIGGKLSSIAVGSSQHVYGLSSKGDIFKWEFNGWKLIQGKLKEITVNHHGHLYGISNKGHVYQYVNTVWKQLPGCLDHINVDSMGGLWGVYKSQVFKFKGSNWKNVSYKFPIGTKNIAAIDPYNVWVVDKTGDIFFMGRKKERKFEVYVPKFIYSTMTTTMPKVGSEIHLNKNQNQPTFNPNLISPPFNPNLISPPQPQVNPNYSENISFKTNLIQPPIVSQNYNQVSFSNNPIDDQMLEEFLKSLRNEPFSKGKYTILESMAGSYYFTCQQLSLILKDLSFSADKTFAMKTFAPKIVDKNNKFYLYNVLTFDSEKKYLDQIFG